MVSVGKIGRRKSLPENFAGKFAGKGLRKIFAGDECFLTTIRLTGKYWEMGKVTGMKHGHRKVSGS